MKIVIRVDASFQTGTGHVMRCLALADVFRGRGAELLFVCRAHRGNLIDLIQSKGFKVATLPEGTGVLGGAESVHSYWLEESWEVDAEQTQEAIGQEGCDWLIVDHYALSRGWESELRGFCKKLMVIDDLADRDHDCDVLLDQTSGRKKVDYQNRVPSYCVLLLGTRYALLRQEFSQWREFSLSRRENPELKRLLVFLGGTDQHNLTGRVLYELSSANLLESMETKVVMGQSALWVDSVYEQAKSISANVEVLIGVSNMAELMACSDLAIGALGTSSWERCCLGLPTLGLVLADNQKMIASELTRLGAIRFCDIDKLSAEFESISNDVLHEMTLNSMKVTDGNGVYRVVQEVL